MRKLLLSPLPLIALLGACTVGPNYAGPPKVATTDAPGGHFVRGGKVATAQAPQVANWWTSLGDTTLNELETRALAGSPNLAVAQARVKQARASFKLERANQLPKASASASYIHAQIPGVDFTGSGNEIDSLDLVNLGFDASWEIDLFGGQRRTVEAARATLESAEANVADAQVQLSAEVAQSYVNLRDRQARLALIRQTGALQRQTLDLTRQRLSRGTASQLDVERLQSQVETTEAQAVPIAAEIESYMNALAVLTGEAPGALDTMLQARGAVPLPPASVAIGDPSELLQRRPDIRAAERKLASQTAKIGQAEAARFPRLSFMGLIGIGGSKISDLTDPGNLSAIIAPQLSWSFLDFGRNAARVRQAEGVRDEAEAQYRQTVLAALQDAEDSLSRFGHRRESLASLVRIKASADRASVLMQQRYRAGTATLIDALDAERQRVVAEQNLAQTSAALTNDYVALQKALGLGWSAEPAAR